MAAAAVPDHDTGVPARELPCLAEHRALVEQMPLRLNGMVAAGLITVDEAEAWIARAQAVLAARDRGPSR